MMKKSCALIFCLMLLVPLCAVEVYSTYAHDTLTWEEQRVYRKIEYAVNHCITEVEDVLPGARENLKVLSAFLDDHPGVFWVDEKIVYRSRKDSDGSVSNRIELFYTHQENWEFDRQRFEQQTEHFHSFLGNENNWIKLYHIYNFLAQNITYDNDYMDQSMWCVFFEGIGVCAGFARSFQYLALRENIPCLVVKGYEVMTDGSRSSIPHEWVMACLNGTWYQFDPTWGLADSNGNVDFNYFCRSRERMGLTHIIENPYPLPDCPSDAFSYVKMRGRYMEAYSRDEFAYILDDAFLRNELTFTVEFDSRTEFNMALNDLVIKKNIFTLIMNLGYRTEHLLYTANPQNFSIRFSVRDVKKIK